MFITSPILPSESSDSPQRRPTRNYELPKRDPTQVLGQQHHDTLCELLQRSLSPHAEVQKPAEKMLHEVEKKHGFASLLLVCAYLERNFTK
jgi:hypothetical protein